MTNRLTRIYTRTGDKGNTRLGDGSKVTKDDLRVNAFGKVDELNSYIGVVRAQLTVDGNEQFDAMLSKIQHQLFNLGGELCMPGFSMITSDCVTNIEKQIDELNGQHPPLKDFILPAGSLACSHTHVARTVCRNAERYMVTLQNRDQNLSAESLQYINRLSDLLFVFARTVARLNGNQEVIWQKDV